jgi:hypothetical protein
MTPDLCDHVVTYVHPHPSKTLVSGEPCALPAGHDGEHLSARDLHERDRRDEYARDWYESGGT